MTRHRLRLPASPAAAIGWEFLRRHRWGLIALAGYLMVLATVKVMVLVRGQAVAFSPKRFAFAVIVPLTATLLYLLAVFTYGLTGDLAARQSMYPTRRFTLPVSTAALAGWPMLYGTLGMMVLWLGTRLVTVWPSGLDIPWIWPALLAAALLAWTQALTWMPYGLAGLRVLVTLLWLIVMDTAVLLALQFKAWEPVMVAILAPQVPLAYLTARSAVARARRGEVPDWRGVFTWLGRLAGALAAGRRRDRFASPAQAQAWFEWRQHGRSLPAWVAILLPFELALLLTAKETPAVVLAILFGALLTPPFMAAFVATTVRRSSATVGEAYGVTPFIATRPMTNPALVAAKLRMVMRSTLASWLVVLVVIPAALVLSDTWPLVRDEGRRAIDFMGTPRVIVLLLVILLGCVASTWKQMVQALDIGLTGREWIVKSSVFLTIGFFSVLGPLVDWILHSSPARAALWDAIPWILAVLVGVKMGAGTWVIVRLYHRRLLSDGTLLVGAGLWCGAALALYGVLAWFFSTPLVPHYVLVLIAILAIPLARVSAAPLVLAWNRHR